MDFSLTTFLLEIINFLVLLWILQRLFYRPVRDAIARRREAVERELADAKAAEEHAAALIAQYQSRLDDWRTEREAERIKLGEEMVTERKRLFATLQDEIASERERQAILEQQRVREQQRRLQTEANARAAAFGARVLDRLAGVRLEADIVTLFVEDCQALQDSTRDALGTALIKESRRVEITSAYVLGPEQREALTTAFEALADAPVVVTWREDGNLLAGISAAIGPLVLQANLREELGFFVEAGQHVA